MSHFLKKKKAQRIVYSKPTILILVIILFLVSRGVWGVYQKNRESALNLQNSSDELSLITEKEQILTNEIEKINTEKGREEEIRSKFNVGKEGESVIVIFEKEKEATSTEAENKGFWGWLLDIF